MTRFDFDVISDAPPLKSRPPESLPAAAAPLPAAAPPQQAGTATPGQPADKAA